MPPTLGTRVPCFFFGRRENIVSNKSGGFSLSIFIEDDRTLVLNEDTLGEGAVQSIEGILRSEGGQDYA